MATIIACDRCGEINIKPRGVKTFEVDGLGVVLAVRKPKGDVASGSEPAEVCAPCFWALVSQAVKREETVLA